MRINIKINRAVSCFLSALVMTVALSAASSAQIGVGISVRIGPPALPVYVQPLCPGEGYIWTPGYWAWDDDDGYYWVPGTWVLAPVGMLWTPGYWGWNNGLYIWNGGYWGPHIGFYGGINYGFGYTGAGFFGGYWQRDRYYYNRSVTNVNVTNITNVYNKTVIVNNNTRVSYNGGNGGVHARATPQQEAAAHERHVAPIGPQIQHQQAARTNRQLFASANHGRPPVAATARPAEFSRGAVPARAAGGAYHPPAMSPREAVAHPASQNRSSGAAHNQAPSPARGSGAHSSQPELAHGNPSTPRSVQHNPGGNHASGTSASGNRQVGEHQTPSSSRPVSPRPENAPSRQNDRSPTSSHAPSRTYRESAPPPNETRSPQREAAPPRRESPPPQREAAPPRHESAPPQHRESAPPSRESAPKPERKPPGK